MTIDQRKALWKEAFADPDRFIEDFFREGYCPEHSMTQEDQGALYWFDCYGGQKKFAYIYAVATFRAHRGKGVCRRLMEKTHQTLQDRGYSGAILVPGSRELFALYEKLGYTTFGYAHQIHAQAAQPVALKPLSWEQYGSLRKAFLPQGGVEQGEQTLRFLSTYASFYTGADFLCAVTADGDRLIGHELLGNREKAAAIVGALGAKTGVFRVPGEKPFAMYRSLDGTAAPGYFGLALD